MICFNAHNPFKQHDKEVHIGSSLHLNETN